MEADGLDVTEEALSLRCMLAFMSKLADGRIEPAIHRLWISRTRALVLACGPNVFNAHVITRAY